MFIAHNLLSRHVSAVSNHNDSESTIISDNRAMPRFPAGNNLHNRTTLGVHDHYTTPPSSGRSSPYDGSNPYGQRFADDLEGQNDEALEGLSAKVKLLKDVSESTRQGVVALGSQ